MMPHANAASLALLALTGCAGTEQPLSGQPLAVASLVTAAGDTAGIAEIRQAADAARLLITVASITPGEHGAHVHMVGQCHAPDFASAGGHLNPSGRAHGTGNPGGSHMGDLPNVTVSSNGDGRLDIALPGDAADWGERLFDADGAAIVVHASPDDYRTDPSGNSGARIACGVFKRPG